MCAVAALAKMGVGGLSDGRQMMPALPPSWATFGQQLAARQKANHASNTVNGHTGQLPNGQIANGAPSSRQASAAARGAGGKSDRPAAGQPAQNDSMLKTGGVRATALAKGRAAPAKGPGLKADDSAAQTRPGWGVTQPAPGATQVAAARQLKVFLSTLMHRGVSSMDGTLWHDCTHCQGFVAC